MWKAGMHHKCIFVAQSATCAVVHRLEDYHGTPIINHPGDKHTRASRLEDTEARAYYSTLYMVEQTAGETVRTARSTRGDTGTRAGSNGAIGGFDRRLDPRICPLTAPVNRVARGCELEDAADAQCGAIFCLEINEGAGQMSSKEFVDEYGATAACNLRLSKEYHHTDRAWGADSWFMGVGEVETLLEHGLFGYGDVKTHTSRYPAKEITELVGPNSGDWAVMTTTVAGDHKIYALAHRRRRAHLHLVARPVHHRQAAGAQGRRRRIRRARPPPPLPEDPQRLDCPAATDRQAQPRAARDARHGEALRHALLPVPPLHDGAGHHLHHGQVLLRLLQP